jgi:hypothetical protein
MTFPVVMSVPNPAEGGCFVLKIHPSLVRIALAVVLSDNVYTANETLRLALAAVQETCKDDDDVVRKKRRHARPVNPSAIKVAGRHRQDTRSVLH